MDKKDEKNLKSTSKTSFSLVDAVHIKKLDKLGCKGLVLRFFATAPGASKNTTCLCDSKNSRLALFRLNL